MSRLSNVLIIFLFLIGIYILYFLYFKRNQLYLGRGITINKINSQVRQSIPPSSIANPIIGNSFTMSFWIYIKDFYYNSDCNCWKHILHKGSIIEPNETLKLTKWNEVINQLPEQCIGIWMKPNKNDIRIAMNVKSHLRPNIEYIDIENIPIRELVNFTFCINNNFIEIYMNGKLTLTKNLSNTIEINKKDIFFNYQNTYSGFMYNFYYLPKKISSKDIKILYSKKPKLPKKK